MEQMEKRRRGIAERSEFELEDLKFKRITQMCPEQYDVFKNGKQVAYIRLRWGHFTVEAPDVYGKLVFEKQFKDHLKGAFAINERIKYLRLAAKKIKKKLQKPQGC